MTQKTLVTFLLDRTGSMSTMKEATIAGFNSYVDTLKKEGDSGLDIEFTFLQFDQYPNEPTIERVLFRQPLANVPPLTDATYLPRGNTPLIDAAYETITALSESLSARQHVAHLGSDPADPKVIVCIQTDGEENCSKLHTWEELNTLIKTKTDAGWQFNFIGAGIDAYQQGAKMGISVANTMSYGTDRVSTQNAMSASASNAAGFASGSLRSTAYTGKQKLASGDKWDPDLKKPAEPKKPAKLDLTR